MSFHESDVNSQPLDMTQPPYPLHPSVANKLSPQYVDFYNKYLINSQPAHFLPIAISRLNGKVLPGTSDNLIVGKTEDFMIQRLSTEGSDIKVRCFTPEGEAPSSGWPVMLYYHGGGWVFGDINTENAVCTNMCVRAHCVVITTDYRLAPEHPYPAPVDDCWETVLWTVTQATYLLHLNTKKLAISGASAGANLAAAVTQRAARLRSQKSKPAYLSKVVNDITFIIQLLVVPVTDNTAIMTNNPTYKAYEFTAALPASKMLWYRNHYLPDASLRHESDASPLLFPAKQFAYLPPAVILVGELDVLRHEGEDYARKLRAAGVAAKVEVMKGMPHPFLAMDAVLDEGKRAITILCESLAEAFR